MNIDTLWSFYISILLLNAILIDCFYVTHDCLQQSNYWLHQLSLQSAAEYDPLWASCNRSIKVATTVSVVAVISFSIFVLPTLLAGYGFGKHRSFTRSIAYLFCHLSRGSTGIVFALELYHSVMSTDLAPKYSTFHWLLMAINQLLPSALLSRLRDEDKRWAEADKLLGGTSKKVKGKFRKFAQSKLNSFTGSPRFKAKLKKIFNTVDMDNSGGVDKKEAYSMVLLLYLYVAQYTRISFKTVPTVDEVMKLYDKIDTDSNGSLTFEEFESMAIILLEEVSTRVSTQMFCQLLIAPFVGYLTCICLRDIVFVGSTRVFFVTLLPSWTIDYIFTETICTTVMAALVNMTLLPLFMEMWTLVFVGTYSEENKGLAGEKETKYTYIKPVIEALQTIFG